MDEKADKTMLTDEQLDQVVGGTGKSDEAYENIHRHFIAFTEGKQIIKETYSQLDVGHVGDENNPLQAPQSPLEGLQVKLGSGSGPVPVLESASQDSEPPIGTNFG